MRPETPSWATDVLAASSSLEERSFELTNAVTTWRMSGSANGWSLVIVGGVAVGLLLLVLVLVAVLICVICRFRKVHFWWKDVMS